MLKLFNVWECICFAQVITQSYYLFSHTNFFNLFCSIMCGKSAFFYITIPSFPIPKSVYFSKYKTPMSCSNSLAAVRLLKNISQLFLKNNFFMVLGELLAVGMSLFHVVYWDDFHFFWLPPNIVVINFEQQIALIIYQTFKICYGSKSMDCVVCLCDGMDIIYIFSWRFFSGQILPLGGAVFSAKGMNWT